MDRKIQRKPITRVNNTFSVHFKCPSHYPTPYQVSEQEISISLYTKEVKFTPFCNFQHIRFNLEPIKLESKQKSIGTLKLTFTC